MLDNNTNIKPKWRIGNVVSLKNNPLKCIESYKNLRLMGDEDYITPLMVITEILYSPNQEMNQFTGEVDNSKGKFQYKCTWFSKKQFRFEEKWFFEKELEIYEENNQEYEDKKFKYGDEIIFKTSKKEILKSKISYSSKNSYSSYIKSSFLHFSSPSFILVGFKNTVKEKEEIDRKHLIRIRWYPKKLVKIKTFNKHADKFSEFLIPIEAISKTDNIEKAALKQFIDIVNYNKSTDEDFIHIVYNRKKTIYNHKKNNFEESYMSRIMTPYELSTQSGIVSIIGKDLFTNKQTISNLTSLKNLNDDKKNKIYLKKVKEIYPNIQLIEENNAYITLGEISNIFKELEYILNHNKRNILLYIEYVNDFNKHTKRYIIPERVVNLNNKDKDKDKSQDYYLKAFCLLREDYRHFKASKIKKIDTIHCMPNNNISKVDKEKLILIFLKVNNLDFYQIAKAIEAEKLIENE